MEKRRQGKLILRRLKTNDGIPLNTLICVRFPDVNNIIVKLHLLKFQNLKVVVNPLKNRTGYFSCNVFVRYSIRIKAGRIVIFIEFYHVFPQSS
jgi:hypothetical protein